jgi:hypothetical protein
MEQRVQCRFCCIPYGPLSVYTMGYPIVQSNVLYEVIYFIKSDGPKKSAGLCSETNSIGFVQVLSSNVIDSVVNIPKIVIVAYIRKVG